MANKSLRKQKVTRKDIRTLPLEFQERFADAVERLMKPNRRNTTSEYAELAKIHGNHCVHGRESFPTQHRAYLYHFEAKLQQADKRNGHDGHSMFLPYQNQMDEELNERELLPNIVLERFNKFPKHFLIELNRGSLRTIRSNLKNARLKQAVFDCLDSAEHWRHASTQQSGQDGPSIEVPHNNVHVALNFPMGNVKSAAFDIMFFLHHCFVDLIYESYLHIEPDSLQEFKEFQLSEQSKGGKNFFDAHLNPFTFPGTKKKIFPKDMFDIEFLGYEYDFLLPKQPLRLQETPPTVAYFPNIDIMKMEGRTYQLHIFILSKTSYIDDSSLPIFNSSNNIEVVEEQSSMPQYVGMAGVFGRGPGCRNCETRDPFQILVDINQTLERLHLNYQEASLKVMCVDLSSPQLKIVPIEETPIPLPSIIGPTFTDFYKTLQHYSEAVEQEQNPYHEVEKIQKYLIRYGFLSPDYDSYTRGIYDQTTQQAVMELQKRMNVTIDGKFGPIMKSRILESRCGCEDIIKKVEVPKDKKTIDDGRLIVPLKMNSKREIKFWLGPQPSNLSQNDTLAEVHKALYTQGEVMEVKFKRVLVEKEATFKITWSLEQMNEKSQLFTFDGPGQTLGRSVFGKSVVLDLSENWRLHSHKHIDDANPAEQKRKSILLLPVLTHELGHVFGLEHSSFKEDVMYAQYKPDAIDLSPNDKELIQKIYVNGKGNSTCCTLI